MRLSNYMKPESNTPTPDIITPEIMETQTTPKSFLQRLMNLVLESKNKAVNEIQRRAALGNLHRAVIEYGSVAVVTCVGVGSLAYFFSTDFNPNPTEIDPQIEVIDPESR
jgi:hypothetical protein